MSDDPRDDFRYTRGSTERGHIPVPQLRSNGVPWWIGVTIGAAAIALAFFVYNVPEWFTHYLSVRYHAPACFFLVILGGCLIHRANKQRLEDDLASRIWEGGRNRPNYWGQ
ncbi:MAG: hypothetical protein U0136_08055 [Bdellovibrionota bacterium]